MHAVCSLAGEELSELSAGPMSLVSSLFCEQVCVITFLCTKNSLLTTGCEQITNVYGLILTAGAQVVDITRRLKYLALNDCTHQLAFSWQTLFSHWLPP